MVVPAAHRLHVAHVLPALPRQIDEERAVRGLRDVRVFFGARYISLSPGGDEETLGDGDEISETQGALVLENLIGEFLTNLGDS